MNRRDYSGGAGNIGKNSVFIAIIKIVITVLFFTMLFGMLYIQKDYLIANPPIVFWYSFLTIYCKQGEHNSIYKEW